MIRGGRRCKEGPQDVMPTSGSFFYFILEGNVMKCYLSMLVLLAVVSTIAFVPATTLAANDPAANQVIETIHLNQATAEQL